MLLFLLCVLLDISTVNASSQTEKLSAQIQQAIATDSFPIDILVDFQDNNKWHHTSRQLMADQEKNPNRQAKLAHLVASLTSATKHSQHRISTLLNASKNQTVLQGSQPHFQSFHNFFIVNTMSVLQADKQIILEIAADETVKKIELDALLDNTAAKTTDSQMRTTLDSSSTVSMLNTGDFYWGVERIGVKKLWQRGIKGNGIVVGSIDSGVMKKHLLLKSNHRKTHGWHDPSGDSKHEPQDSRGHGSHTVGIMVGSEGYGVAPEAEWIACRNSGGRFEDKPKSSYILKCMEFMTCPWDALTLQKDCSKAPHVVNNSWGISRADSQSEYTRYDAAISLWRKNGIIPVFAAGNDRQKMPCGSMSYPAELNNVIAVGATNEKNALGFFSSTGPSINGLMKPDISAPGRRIWSASIKGLSSVETRSGTSMAAPHVSGVIALWLSLNSSLTYQQIYELLTQEASHNVAVLNLVCSANESEAKFSFPNNMYGHGLVDATSILRSPHFKNSRGSCNQLTFSLNFFVPVVLSLVFFCNLICAQAVCVNI